MASPASARAAHLHEEKNATGTRSGIPAAFFLPLNETADGMANDMLSAKDDKTILRVAALAVARRHDLPESSVPGRIRATYRVPPGR